MRLSASARHLLAALLLGSLTAGAEAQKATPQDDALLKAAAVFRKYVQLSNSFDPALADLYAEGAVIRIKRAGARDETIPTARYKAALRASLAKAKAGGETYLYGDCASERVRAKVRIACTRESERTGSSSLFKMIVGPTKTGEWRIFEEER